MPLLALAVAWVLLCQTGCQEQAKAPDEPQAELVTTETGPEIAFEKTIHDFGEVAPGKKYTGEFKFTNTGDGLLKITEVQRCCGTATKLDKEELAPGESGVLKVVYNSGQGSGVMRRKLSVSSNDKENPEVVLRIQAKIVPKVVFEPQKMELVLNEENGNCPNITVTSMDDQPFSIKTFTSTGNSITADIDPAVEATKFVLRPKVDLAKLQKRPTGFVAIGLTHPECESVHPYFSTLLKFEIKPRSIILFDPEQQKPIVKKVSLASNYGEDFEVESTSSQNGLAKFISQEKTAKGYQFEVEIIPPPADDTGKFTDVLYVNLKGGQKLSIKCYGKYLSK